LDENVHLAAHDSQLGNIMHVPHTRASDVKKTHENYSCLWSITQLPANIWERGYFVSFKYPNYTLCCLFWMHKMQCTQNKCLQTRLGKVPSFLFHTKN